LNSNRAEGSCWNWPNPELLDSKGPL